MNIENAKSQMRKGMLEYCILLLLERQPAYSSDIIRSLKEAELLVVEGTLYPLLNRLKREGLLQYRWEESRMGPPRKYYALTDVDCRCCATSIRHGLRYPTPSTT